jgi:acyl-CoA thioesterase
MAAHLNIAHQRAPSSIIWQRERSGQVRTIASSSREDFGAHPGTRKDLIMDILKKFVEKDHFAKHLGIEMLEYGTGKAKARMALKGHHLNSAGTVHGGAIFSLADAVFSVASNSHGTLAMAINVSISFFKAAKNGVLLAEAEEVSINPKLATYLITVRDEAGNAIALFQGTVYRKKDSIGEVVK